MPDVTVTADRVFLPSAEVGLADGFGASLDVFQFLGSGPVGIVPGLSYSAHGFEDITTIHLIGPTIGIGARFPIYRSENLLLLAGGVGQFQRENRADRPGCPCERWIPQYSPSIRISPPS